MKILDDTNYVVNPAYMNLGDLVRKNYGRELSYFFDSIIKVFSSKVSNFDVIIIGIQLISNSLLYDQFFNLRNVIINKVGAKLGK